MGQLNPLIGEKIYALAILESSKIFRSLQRLNLPFDANLGVDVNPFIGPIFLGGAYGDRGHPKLYFKVGRIF